MRTDEKSAFRAPVPWLEFGAADGPVVLALHGFPQTATAWTATAERLADAGFRVIAPCQRGYTANLSPAGRLRYGVEHLSDDIVRLMGHLDIDKAHIVGHDLGAMVAWDLAIWYPERVLSVVSVAAPHPAAFALSLRSSDQALRSWYFLFFQFPMVPELVFSPREAHSRARLERVLASSGLPRSCSGPHLDQLADGVLFSCALGWYRAMPWTPRRRILRKSTVPSFILWGDRDRFVSRRSIELSQRYMANPTEPVVFPGAGHWLLDTESDKVAEAITSRLRDIR